MKIKAYKIANVDKTVCCVEQKLASNYCWFKSSILLATYRKLHTEEEKNQFIKQAIQKALKEEFKIKFNADVLELALNSGLQNYLDLAIEKNNYKVFTSYEEIGNWFAIPKEYEIY